MYILEGGIDEKLLGASARFIFISMKKYYCSFIHPLVGVYVKKYLAYSI
jgi:hypothetical protein